jgi:hypothetical protein
MILPGFTAEMSLSEPASLYRTDGAAATASQSGTLAPALPVDPFCAHWCAQGRGNNRLCCDCMGGVWMLGRCFLE